MTEPSASGVVDSPRRYLASDGRLTLLLEVAEEGGFVVTSPFDPQLITQAETLEEAFEMAYDALPCLKDAESSRSAPAGVPHLDPAAATGTEAELRFAFADTLRMLTNRINIFVSLPLAKLDHLSLQKQLDAIGKTKDAAAPATAAE